MSPAYLWGSGGLGAQGPRGTRFLGSGSLAALDQASVQKAPLSTQNVQLKGQSDRWPGMDQSPPPHACASTPLEIGQKERPAASTPEPSKAGWTKSERFHPKTTVTARRSQ